MVASARMVPRYVVGVSMPRVPSDADPDMGCDRIDAFRLSVAQSKRSAAKARRGDAPTGQPRAEQHILRGNFDTTQSLEGAL